MTPQLRVFAPPSFIAWLLIVGGSGFAAGFFGPMIFVPGANQGPLVGILMSGPGGVFLGFALFAISRLSRADARWQWRILLGSSTLLALVTLYFIMPGPEFHGYLQEVTVQSCRTPIDLADDAIARWNREIASRPSAARPGWQEDSREMLQADPGPVLTVRIARQRTIFETRKPWDKGRVVTEDWQDVNADKTYYAQYPGSSCATLPAGMQATVFNDQFFRGYPTNLGWPPRKLVNFLGLQTIEPVPENYQQFAK